MLQLRVLGPLDFRNPDGSELRRVVTQPRRLALLVYLATANPRAFHRRDTLLGLFWPEQSVDRARASLSRAIYFLRHELGPDLLVSRGDEEIALDAGQVWCDAVAFADALQQGRFRDALSLYRGDLMPGFFVPDAKGFEEWIEQERSRLRERASAARLSWRRRRSGPGTWSRPWNGPGGASSVVHSVKSHCNGSSSSSIGAATGRRPIAPIRSLPTGSRPNSIWRRHRRRSR